MRNRIVNFCAYIMNCMLTALSAIPMPIICCAPKSNREDRLKELRIEHENRILNSALPDSTKQNLLVSLHAPQDLEGVKSVMASDFQMISVDMEIAVKQFTEQLNNSHIE